MKKVMLMILDGWGVGKEYEGNAIYLANTPNMDYLMENYPNILINASEEYVGLPKGQMGNSEVGHLNIGSGRVIYQDFSKINNSIKDGSFFKNIALNNAIDHAIKNNSSLHLMGLVSYGGVHSHMDHLIALLHLCRLRNFSKVYIHVFLDGRDVSPTSGLDDIKYLDEKIKEIGVGKIESISGRYYAMDRDKRWERIEKAYNTLVYNENLSSDIKEVIQKSYNDGVTDEFIIPTIFGENTIKENDSIIFFNFRPDRGRELTEAFINNDFDHFKVKSFTNLKFVTMTEYDEEFKNIDIVFPSEVIKDTLGEVLSRNNLKQLRIAETEKYPHVTFFFNGGVEDANNLEDRILIPSPKVATYDLEPAMSSVEVKNQAIVQINSQKYKVIILNFANPDMVGHAAVIPATIKAIETIDSHIKEITDACLKNDYDLIITADHGNAEKLLDYVTKEPFTSHTTNLVPLILITKNKKELIKGNDLALKDIAPTILDLLGIEKPSTMTGSSLIKGFK